MNYHSRAFVAGQACAKHLAYIFPFNPYANCPRHMLLVTSITNKEMEPQRKLNNLSKLLR